MAAGANYCYELFCETMLLISLHKVKAAGTCNAYLCIETNYLDDSKWGESYDAKRTNTESK